MKVDPAELKQKSGIVEDAASSADGALSAARGTAVSAKPGFPGDAAAPFASTVSALEPIDSSLVRNSQEIATKMAAGAEDYQHTDYGNSENLALPADALGQYNSNYASAMWRFRS